MLQNLLMKSHQNSRHPMVYSLCLMIMFFTMFDATMLYMTPILLNEHNFSNTVLGLIIACSSLCGAIFDFLMCKIFKRADFRRFFMVMFVICAVYPFFLWQANTALFFIIAMAFWGIYFDLVGVGTFDFVARFVEKKNNSQTFGLLQIFRAISFVLTPIAVGILISNSQNSNAIYFAIFALILAMIFFVQLSIQSRRIGPIINELSNRRRNLLIELHLWKKIGKSILPVLLTTFFIFICDSFFWTLAPIFTQSEHLAQYSGLFLTAYTLPALLVGASIGKITKKFGKKRSAMYAILLGCLILTTFGFWHNELMYCLIIFLSSFFISIALPSINSVYTDFMEEKPIVENEIENLEDFSFNLGYLIGPIIAGLLSDLFSIPIAFSLLGILGAICSLILIRIVPRHIKIRVSPKDISY